MLSSWKIDMMRAAKPHEILKKDIKFGFNFFNNGNTIIAKSLYILSKQSFYHN